MFSWKMSRSDLPIIICGQSHQQHEPVTAVCLFYIKTKKTVFTGSTHLNSADISLSPKTPWETGNSFILKLQTAIFHNYCKLKP